VITFAVANQKGGVGKTSTTINLAGALARKGKKTLLVDLDPQGSLTEYFFELTSLPYTSYDVLVERKFVKPLPLGDFIDIIPANIDLAAAEILLPTMSNSDKRLSLVLKNYKYDYCLIDCPPSLGHLTKNALTASDFIIIPVSTDLMAQRALKLIMNTINDVIESELNPRLMVWKLLPTRHSIKEKESKQVLDEFIGTYKHKVYPEPVMERSNYKKAVRGQVDIAAIDSNLGDYWDRFVALLIKECEALS